MWRVDRAEEVDFDHDQAATGREQLGHVNEC
jgi:hypothetical protein